MRKAILPILAVILIGTGAYFFLQKDDKQPVTVETKKAAEINQAWIEISSGSAFLKTGGQGVELKNGDSLQKGVSVETGRTGTAVIHFPDGSVLRMDKETSITLNDIYFKTDDRTLNVNIGLTIGRVWSKVVGLSTPSSSWEVKTANTVASVRGTAFGMGYKNGQSWILGSEHSVAVSPIDPISKEKISQAEVILESDKLVQIGDKEIKIATSATTTGALNSKVVDITLSFKNDVWIQDSKRNDQKLEAQIEEIRRTSSGDENKVREELIETTKESQEKLQPGASTNENGTAGGNKSSDFVPAQNPPATSLKIEDLKDFTLSVKTLDKTDGISEGSAVKLSATAVSGADIFDVTSDADWAVLGSIGKVTSGGVFVAKLGDDVSELGEAVGYVVATYRGKMAQSPLIHVKAAGPQTPLDIGGQ